MHNIEAADLREVPKNGPILWALDAYYSKRLRVYTIVDFSFIRTFAPSF